MGFPVKAVVAALANAVNDGTAAVLEQRSTKQVSTQKNPLSVRLIIDLLRRPLWLIAIVLNITGVILQIVALHYGALALVQPILVCDLIFAALIGSAFRHQWPDWEMLLGVLCCAGGLALFLAGGPAARRRGHGAAGGRDPAGHRVRRGAGRLPGGGRHRAPHAAADHAGAGLRDLLRGDRVRAQAAVRRLARRAEPPALPVAAVRRGRRRPARLPAQPERLPGRASWSARCSR